LPQFVPTIFLLLVLILAFLMVSRVRYLNLDGLLQLFGRKMKIAILVLAPLLIADAFLRRMGVALFSLFLIYLIFSPFMVKSINHTVK